VDAKNCLIGGIASQELIAKLEPLVTSSSDYYYQSITDNKSMFLLARGNHFFCRENPKHVLIAAGHICNSEKETVNLEALKEIEKYYLKNANFPIDNLEGSFVIILLNKTTRTITIYRNIVGLPPIYYSRTQKSAIFSDNLSILVQILSQMNCKLKLNSRQLSTHLMFGNGSGRETLFKGIFKVMPGEQAYFGKNYVDLSQLQTFVNMVGPKIDNCVEYLEKVMRRVINEYVRAYPRIGSFFSGGVDSSYIQAHLVQDLSSDSRTYSIDLIHTSWKKEREYAKSGSEFFKLRHTFVTVTPRTYPKLLLETSAMLGHPLSHAQTAFVPALSRVAVQDVPVCLCGMCADTLFGIETSRTIDNSYQISKLLPRSFFRQMMMRVIEILRKIRPSSEWLQTLQECLELEIENDSSPNHPFNTSQRANLKLMFDLVGKKGVTKTMSQRRTIFRRYQVTGTLKERLHFLHLLNGGTESCERFYQLGAWEGLKVLFPFLDSRIIKAALSMNPEFRFQFKQTKKVLKEALEKYLPKEFIYRKKSAWGVPIFEWLGSGGVLFQLVEEINEYPFLKGKTSVVKGPQDWFLWSLLTFDLWHKLFIDQNSYSNLCKFLHA